MADLSKIPLVALSIDTKVLVSTLLNPIKYLPTEDGLPRDWRGLAHLYEIDGRTIPSISSNSDPTGCIITILENNKSSTTIEEFQSFLGKLDRWDIVDDAQSLFERDTEKYIERLERCGTSAIELGTDTEKQALTIDDLYRLRQGLTKQCYDAFLLYSEEDMEFVEEMIENLEKKHQLKLCIKDRDLIGGITFEHEAVMQLISERCNRLIVVVSPNFLKSPANKFFLNYAQAVGIEMRQRKIIPCLYKKCQLPPQLSYTFILDYSKGKLYDFWGRLSDSVKVVAVENASNGKLPTQQLGERQNGEKSIESKIEIDSTLARIDMASFSNGTGNPHKQKTLNEAQAQSVSPEKLVKQPKSKPLISWPKRKRATDSEISEKEFDTAATETLSISLNLPSLDDLPPLDIIESTSGDRKLTKRKKNLVRTCVKKVQSLITKS